MPTPRRTVSPAVATALSLAALLLAGAGSEPPLRGFSSATARAERELEAAFVAIPSPDEARRWHRHFTAEPHPAGSERNNELARFIAEEWKKQGLEDVTLYRYDVLNTAPKRVSLEMLEPVRFTASLREEPYAVDPDTSHPGIDPAYLGMSASGVVEAPVVYAHSGNPEDYAVLREHGIDVRGKIVLVRYSNPYSYRGFKALTAEREGAAGILIYSDPMEDGYTRGPVFPDGPWGPESHIQRGAITYDFIVPGDPLTPGWPSLPGARQVKPAEALSLPKIVGLPLSWKDAKPLLENLDGPAAPRGWQGALPLTYRLGGERVKVRLAVEMDNRVAPNYVVEARVRGAEFPDEWIVLGNHRDAWVFGGVDPSSGTASMMELTRAFGELAKRGMRPRRTLVFCSWDGEEVGLTGSTEWGEQFADELKAKAIAYLNVDSSASGPRFEPSAVASLAPLVREVSRDLEDPAGRSLLDALRADRARQRQDSGDASGPVPDAELVDTRIGSGSDHTVFLNHLGVPTVGLSFDGPYGVYHSMYDDFFWMDRIGDPGYRYHALMARVWGTLALRLADAELLPLDAAEYARHLRGFVDELVAAHPRAPLDLDRLRAGVDAFEQAGERLNAAVAAALAAGPLEPALARRVNRGVRELERNWLNPEGIPGRPWFKHTLYAARYTYAHLELPGLTEAFEDGDWTRAGAQARILDAALARNTALVADLARDLGSTRTERLAHLEARLAALRDAFPGEMAIYLKHLGSGEEIALDADAVYETFSVIKIPIMAEVLRQAEAGAFSLSDRVTLKPADGRIPSGVLYALDPGLQPTIKDLVTLMIIISDNAATDLLADKVGRERITRTLREWGLAKTEIAFSDLDWDRRWLGRLDPDYLDATGDETLRFPFGKHRSAAVREAFARTIDDSGLYFGHSTARETATLLERIARGTLVSPRASALMRETLSQQQVDDRFPRYLRDVGLAHKTGDGQPTIANDAGILTIGGEDVVLVVFTGRHRGTTAAVTEAVARVAGLVAWHYGGAVTSDFEPWR